MRRRVRLSPESPEGRNDLAYAETPASPPHEYASALLEVSKGCAYGKCLFCNLCRDTPFRPVPRDKEGIVATLEMRRRQTNDEAMGALRMKMLAM